MFSVFPVCLFVNKKLRFRNSPGKDIPEEDTDKGTRTGFLESGSKRDGKGFAHPLLEGEVYSQTLFSGFVEGKDF